MKRGGGFFGGTSVCHMPWGLSQVVQRQLACSREGHAGRSWVAVGLLLLP